ncbi:MAG TPA: hypothetical protein DFS52_14275 [Myxococcales bacterium]|jgi:hypothetical protein|nr:hypothetical protein [Myxococcales bacterium]
MQRRFALLALVSSLCCSTLALADSVSAGILLPLRTYENDYTMVQTYRHAKVPCTGGTVCATHGFLESIGTQGYSDANADVFLTGWRVTAKNGAVSTNELRVRLFKSGYDPIDRSLKWSAELYLGSGSDFSVDYDFAVVTGTGYKLVSHELANSCTYDESTGACMNAAILTNARPSLTWDFLGFVIKGFAMRTTSGVPVELGQVQLDGATHSSVFGYPLRRRQTMNCGFFGLNSQAEIEPFQCDMTSVGIAVNNAAGTWFETNWSHRSKSFYYLAPAGTYAQTEDLFAPNYRGLLAGLSYFDLMFASGGVAPVESLSAGCFDPRYDSGYARWDWEGSLFTSPREDFGAEIKCLSSRIGPEL